ncbi:MAG: SRPBCC family protein [Synechococcales bacterium]|nr:SRPBCC family protein [Synechococcales bacterium]
MTDSKVFEQSIQIKASATVVEQCFTDLALMHRWLNPLLRCQPIGTWSTHYGSESLFVIQIPWIHPTLRNVVVQREPGLVVWEFSGFFCGRDRWECQPTSQGTLLLNRFEFEIPNPIVRFGFETFAANLTAKDMQAQLRRLKRTAEELYRQSGQS